MRKIAMLLAALTLSMVQNACVTTGYRTVAGPTIREVVYDTIRSSSMSADSAQYVFEDLAPYDSPAQATRIYTEAQLLQLKGFACATEAEQNNLRMQIRRTNSPEEHSLLLQQFARQHPEASCPDATVRREIVIATMEPRGGNYRERTGAQYVNPASVQAYRAGGYGANEAQMRAEARRLLNPRRNAADEQLYQCIVRSGLTEAQRTEYLTKLATGQYVTKPIPEYVRLNGACRGADGEFIHLIQGPGETFRPLYAEVTLSDGTIVGAGAHCWNLTFPAQAPRVVITLRRRREEDRIVTREVLRPTTRQVPIREFWCTRGVLEGLACLAPFIAGAITQIPGGDDGNKTEDRPPTRVNRIPVVPSRFP